VVTAATADLRPLVEAARPLLSAPAETVDVVAELDDGRRLVGTVTGLRGETLLRVTFATLSPRHRLRAWVQLLALTAARPERSWETTTIGKRRGGGGTVSHLRPLSPEVARSTLAELVRLRDQGLCRPLPMSAKASAAYAEARARFDVAPSVDKATNEWTGGRIPGEADDPAHVLVYGEGSPVDVLLAEPGDGGEPHRFGELARLVWDPLLAHERLVSA
jgi:exodeoxyribonuclease V gamma subunit